LQLIDLEGRLLLILIAFCSLEGELIFDDEIFGELLVIAGKFTKLN
jgi:hypothetical protein